MWQAAKSSNNDTASSFYGVKTQFEGREKIRSTYRNMCSNVEKATLDFDIPWYVVSLLRNMWEITILGLIIPFNMLSLALKYFKKAMA